jgi:hypothetical protein
MDRRRDPRTIVTPYAFSVHPDLLGIPLATPWQRLGAIAIDGAVILGLSRIGGTTLALAAGLLLFWVAIRTPSKDIFGQLFRGAVGCLGVSILVITLVVVFAVNFAERVGEDPAAREALRSRIEAIADSAGVEIGVGLGGGEATDSLGLEELALLVPNIFALQGAEDAEVAREIATAMAFTGREGGMSLQQIRETLTALMPEDAPWSGEAQSIVDHVMSELRVGLPASPGEGPQGPAQSESRQSVITDSLALDSIAALNRLVVTLDEERGDVEEQLRRTRSELEEEQERGLLDWLWNLVEDLGLGFGWGALYLTVTHAWWRGTSVGKKIFRIRVVMIDKRPLNWWLSFERAGGYAAGFATGLLGFAQIFWDPNRQAIHDKVSETVVIQDGKPPIPGPWMTEAKRK